MMILGKTILALIIFQIAEGTIYLYKTEDGFSVESYDCIYIKSLLYCRRPVKPISLQRENKIGQCYHNGTIHYFDQLQLNDIGISTVLHQWKSSIEKVEQYSRYMRHPTESSDYICECTHLQSFGKNCEYLLPTGTTLIETLDLKLNMQLTYPWQVQIHSDIVCYITIECNYGMLCLDWRDICNGVQQCMSGLDEENCDKLEFNECEDDEYRCTNGMCIPDEYFLDGEFDCLDWSDEIQYYDDEKCVLNGASFQCDDRICPPNQWSCGDGQCIFDRLGFQKSLTEKSECKSRRDQYFICETHYSTSMWTLPNGKCQVKGYNEPNVEHRTIEEECYYLVKCALSSQAERHCPCGRGIPCQDYISKICSPEPIQYPKKGILAPYILHLYNRTRDWGKFEPNFVQYNGTIKCGRFLIHINTTDLFPYNTTLEEIENIQCRNQKGIYLPDENFHSWTFNNRSYSFINVCNESKEYISAYRIRDGIYNCIDKMDELENNRVTTTCSNSSRHRFRCSIEEVTCLSVIVLGNSKNNCKNKFDELWMGTSKRLSNMNCNSRSKDECNHIREYIKMSWTSIDHNKSISQRPISFRAYCNTFWNLDSKEDENIDLCKIWWICSEDQWQCRTGQCIDKNWILDGERDCSDASDEEGLLDQLQSDRNIDVLQISGLKKRFDIYYDAQPFSMICNTSKEFPCLRINVSDPLNNLTDERPCINLHQVGDGHIDCHGAIDERNTMKHCDQSTMLGYNYWCQSSGSCIPYWLLCSLRCFNLSDDKFECTRRQNTTTCGNIKSFACFNGTCVRDGRCNRNRDCIFGEDEYMCDYEGTSNGTSFIYREQKEVLATNAKKNIRLLQFSNKSNIIDSWIDLILTTQSMALVTTSPNLNSSLIFFSCNRGIGVYMHDGSIVCFCPTQYYGDKCEFHADRLSVLFHLNLSQSIYSADNDHMNMLKLLVLFQFKNETLSTQEFHVESAVKTNIYKKMLVHFIYPRSSELLQHKKERYFNRSNIINDHPYSIFIELYKGTNNKTASLIAVWQYPIYFDYLPVFRLAKVLHLTKPNIQNNPCSSNPCNKNQDCQEILNEKFKYICLCKSNFTGENCLVEDQLCVEGYCSPHSLCKPNYGRLVRGNVVPYCICPFNRFGARCNIEHDQCSSSPCQHGGSCFSTSTPDRFTCLCTSQYHGQKCELKKPEIKLYINQSVDYASAVIQYFHIDFTSFDLILVHQKIYTNRLVFLEYSSDETTTPEIILAKLYSSHLDISAKIYLVSLEINATSIHGTSQISERNQCVNIHTLTSGNNIQSELDFVHTHRLIIEYSPITYHHLCWINRTLVCFHDNSYLCICSNDHSHVECFIYDHNLDHCSHCLAGGRCMKGNRFQSNDFVCLCPPCHSGSKCQFNSNSFAFTLDQLFFIDLTSSKQKIVMCLLIIGSLLMYLIALPNNVFALVTFRRRKCLGNSVGYYLFYMCIINQINIGLLVARLVDLSVTITGLQSRPILDNIICKVFSYSLSCSTRMAYWLASFIALERVYTTVFLKPRRLEKPRTAQCLTVLTLSIILLSGAYELVFVKAFSSINDGNSIVCVIDFPIVRWSLWMLIHQIVSISNYILPVFINTFCTIMIICVIIKKKMNVRASKNSNVLPHLQSFFSHLTLRIILDAETAKDTLCIEMKVLQASERQQTVHVKKPKSNLSEG